MKEEREEEAQTGTLEEEQTKEEVLDSLLRKVDLNDPVIVEDARGNEVAITKQQFIEFYLPAGTSQLEAFHCFQQVRASGLNPLIKGQCHFFKTGDGPVSLFTGYEVYLARAYRNGMEHMDEPVWDIGEDGLPVSCTLTIKIKGRPDFTRTTRYAEVVGLYNGKPNKRWDRAPFQMTEKCTTINTLRLAGIAAVEDLPYAIEEMGDPVVVGHRTLTQEHLDAYGAGTESEEVAVGEVTAADHQIDTDKDRRRYRAIVAEQKVFTDDDQRKRCQFAITGKASTADFDHGDYLEMFDAMVRGKVKAWTDNDSKPDPPTTGGDPNLENMADLPEEHAEEEQSEQSIQERLFLAEASTRFATPENRDAWCLALFDPSKPREEWSDTEYAIATKEMFPLAELHPQNAPENTMDGDSGATTQGEPGEGQEQADTPASKATLAGLSELVKNFPGAKYMTVKSNSFKERAAKDIGRTVATIKDYTESEAQAIIASLKKERLPLLSADELSKQHAEDDETWFRSPERAMAMADYNERIKHKFSNPDELSKWQEEHTGINTTSRWHQEHFDKASDALDREELVKQAQEEARAEMAELKQGAEKDGGMTPEEQKEFIKGAVITGEKVGKEITENIDFGKFSDTPEWKELNREYFDRLLEYYKANQQPAFQSVESQSAWQREIAGNADPALWDRDAFALANAGLDDMGVADADAETPKQTGSEPASPATEDLVDGDGKCTDTQYNSIAAGFAVLVPDKVDSNEKNIAVGTAPARDFMKAVLVKIAEATGGEPIEFHGVRLLDTSHADDIILALEDQIRENAAEKPKNVV